MQDLAALYFRSNPFRSSLAWLLAAALAAPAAAAEPAPSAAEPAYTIERQQDVLVVRAENADVEEVVTGLGEEVGFDVRVLTAVERPPVSGEVEGANAAEVLQKLLRDRNYALVYDSAGPQQLQRVVILSPPPEERWVPAASAVTPPDAEERRRQRLKDMVDKRRRERLRQLVEQRRKERNQRRRAAARARR